MSYAKNKGKACPSKNISIEGHFRILKAIGVHSGCFPDVITKGSQPQEFAVRPDSLDLLKLALINDLAVWIEQNPEVDWYNVEIYSEYSKCFFLSLTEILFDRNNYIGPFF